MVFKKKGGNIYFICTSEYVLILHLLGIAPSLEKVQQYFEHSKIIATLRQKIKSKKLVISFDPGKKKCNNWVTQGKQKLL